MPLQAYSDLDFDFRFCNAGLSGRGFIAEMDYSIVEKTFAVNVHGTFKVAQVWNLLIDFHVKDRK